MTTPSDRDNGQPTERVNLEKGDPTSEAPFDPYRFGKPDHPIPAEYAPPGYTGPVTPAAGPYEAPNPFGPPPYGGQPTNPFSNPPGTPYGGPQQHYQYPPTPYGPGAPPPPMYHGYAPPRSSNGKAVASLVLGILSIVMFWLTIFDSVFIVLALIFGLIALSETKSGAGHGRGMAIAGLVCTAVGTLAATVFTVLIVHAANQCGGFSNNNTSVFQDCVRHHLHF